MNESKMTYPECTKKRMRSGNKKEKRIEIRKADKKGKDDAKSKGKAEERKVNKRKIRRQTELLYERKWLRFGVDKENEWRNNSLQSGKKVGNA